MTKTDPLVKASGISKTYRSGDNEMIALSGMDLDVMDGEFLCQDVTYVTKAIGGGNFLILAETQAQALRASERAIVAMRKVPQVIMPFPGGIVRSGSMRRRR